MVLRFWRGKVIFDELKFPKQWNIPVKMRSKC